MRKDIIGAVGIIALGAATLSLLDEPGTAADYVIVRDGVVKEIRRNYTPPIAGKIKHINGISVLRPYVHIKPDFDRKTQVREGPKRVIADTEVTDTWTVRDKTTLELSDDKDAQVEAIDSNLLGDILFDLAQEAINPTPARSEWRSRMKALIR